MKYRRESAAESTGEKVKDTCQAGFIQVVSRTKKAKAKKDTKKQPTVSMENRPPKVKADTSGGATKKKVRKRRRTKSPALLKPTDAKALQKC